MTIADRMTRQAEEQAAALLSQLAVDVAFVNRCGTLSTIVASTAARIATDWWDHPINSFGVPYDEIRRDGAKGIPLPYAFLLAVTAAEIHVFKIRMVMGNVRLKDDIAVFERAGLEFAAHEETLVTAFHIRAPGQRQDMAFEITKSEYATDFAALLRQA